MIPECTCKHNIDSNGRDPNCPLHKWRLDLPTIRTMKEQLVSKRVHPKGNHGVYFAVTTKAKVRRVLKELGFTQKKIREIMKRIERNK